MQWEMIDCLAELRLINLLFSFLMMEDKDEQFQMLQNSIDQVYGLDNEVVNEKERRM